MNPELYIFCGIPFSGKSTISKEVAERKGYTRIDLDDVKFELYGQNTLDADLKQEDWDTIYQTMYQEIEEALKDGKIVIHDTGNFTRHERDLVRQIADKLGVETTTVLIDTPLSIAKQRMLTNRKTNERFNITDQEFQDAVAEMEAPDDTEKHFSYEQDKPVDAWIEKYFV